MTEDQREAIRRELHAWRRRHQAVALARDPLVARAIIGAGLTKEEVHFLTGLGRTTIDRIVARGQEG